MQELSGKKHWFHEKRFGMFVHWGIYAVGGIHEQQQMRLQVPAAEYQQYAARFDPADFDPARWLDLAQHTGMEYMVFTAKHHDGFCMWDTKETDYNIMNTPYGRDVLRMLADECHKRDFPLEIYYSCVDWHHPAYPNIGRHHEISTDPRFHDMDTYMDFLKRQIRELCTGYGTIHGIWWDMNVPGWQDHSIAEMINTLQPAAVINNRGYGPGDYSTPERNFQKEAPYPFAKPVEACDSVGQYSWGYRRDEDYFSVRKLERQIAFYTALGGNFLLNAGPDETGRFPEKVCSIFDRIGKWHKTVARALTAKPCYGVIDLPGIICTGEGRELNLILLDPPLGGSLRLNDLRWLPEKALLLNTGKELTVTPGVETEAPAVTLRDLSVDMMNDEIQVIRLEFGGDVIHSAGEKVYEDSSGSVLQG